MSNYNAAAAAKNPPWQQQSNLPIMQGQQLNTGLLQYPQTALLQAQQLIQQTQPASMLYGNTATTNQHQAYGNTSTTNTGYNHLATASNVTYPTRQLNSTAFATSSSLLGTGASNTGLLGSAPTTFPKQRVFTGTITKRQDNFGFVDEDVFFQVDVCAKGSNPRIGDKVLVEAAYNPSMPFKWNATRIQVLPIDRDRGSGYSRFSSTNNSSRYSPVGSNDDYKRRTNNLNDSRGNNDSNRRPFYKRSPERSASTTDRKRRFDAVEPVSRARSPRRDSKERERSPGSGSTARRSRSSSPKRRRTRPTVRYAVSVPKFALDLSQADLLELRRRYSNMYIPSDFFISSAVWLEAFPPDRPFSLQHPCSFHVMPKEVDSYLPNDAVLDPPDVDYLFSAKVMLLSMPKIEEVFKKCITLGEDLDKDHKSCVHPSRLINFLVGTRGKSETMAIGGPWSESLDGPNPDKDPSVLIRTAIRTTKALTGVDLSKCTKWFKFVELYYRRQESTNKGRTVSARVETVVIYVPDVWNCVPTQLEWDGLGVNYKKLFAAKINKEDKPAEKPAPPGGGEDEKDTTMECDSSIVAKREPTHYSQLDIKNMKFQDLREELEARSLSSKGLKSQLTARLAKALKQEQSEDDAKGEAEDEEEEDEVEEDKKEEKGGDKKNGDGEGDATKKEKDGDGKEEMSEKEKQRLERKYTLPELPSVIVHPNTTAKSGKFNCEVMSLSLLLDYRFDDAKEHSFEVALFAELFNEMLMRDFGFQIFKAIHNAPEPVKEEKEDKEKEEKEKSNKTDDEKVKEKSPSEETKEKEDKKEEKEEKKEKDSNTKDKKKEKEEKEKKKEREEREKRRKEEKELKSYTENPFLLLCCVYFDTTHIGYMYDKDLEDLLLTLGLSLSRSQVKKLVQKVLSKERNNFAYRKLTDKPLVEGTEKTTLTEIKFDIDILKQLIEGNRKFLPVFVDPSTVGKSPKKGTAKGSVSSVEGMVMYQGSVVDIGNLQTSLEKSDTARLNTESSLMKLRSEHTSLEKSTNKLKDKLSTVTSQLEKVTGQLNGTKGRLVAATGTNEQLMQLLEEIHKKVGDFVVKPKPKEEEKPVEKEETKPKENEDETEPKEEPKAEANGIEEKEEEEEEVKEDEVKEKEDEAKVKGEPMDE
uniref:Cell division cycle and apoptosis regulator protein 1 n=1 Tax=Cacopsylla melanoneura TaxID=428564 RepID=A0A8D8X8X7_9HEMI